MAVYDSAFLYFVFYDDGSCGCPAGYFVSDPLEIPGISQGGDDETFSVGDFIDYTDISDPDDPLTVTLEYVGYADGGWIGREQCGCEDPPVYDYYYISNDDSLLSGDEITVVADTFTVCFLAGTVISCPGGARPIEDLAVGDLVVTADGDVRPVRFVGRQTVATMFADPLRTRPIRIAAGALGAGLPIRDLCVSPDHALFIGGALVQAGALVDGAAIAPMTDLPERFTYFHVELADHSLILAEGVPAETFVDNVTRRRFDNYADYEALYGEHAPSIAEMALPRVKSARQVPRAVRMRQSRRGLQLSVAS